MHKEFGQRWKTNREVFLEGGGSGLGLEHWTPGAVWEGCLREHTGHKQRPKGRKVIAPNKTDKTEIPSWQVSHTWPRRDIWSLAQGLCTCCSIKYSHGSLPQFFQGFAQMWFLSEAFSGYSYLKLQAMLTSPSYPGLYLLFLPLRISSLALSTIRQTRLSTYLFVYCLSPLSRI